MSLACNESAELSSVSDRPFGRAERGLRDIVDPLLEPFWEIGDDRDNVIGDQQHPGKKALKKKRRIQCFPFHSKFIRSRSSPTARIRDPLIHGWSLRCEIRTHCVRHKISRNRVPGRRMNLRGWLVWPLHALASRSGFCLAACRGVLNYSLSRISRSPAPRPSTCRPHTTPHSHVHPRLFPSFGKTNSSASTLSTFSPSCDLDR